MRRNRSLWTKYRLLFTIQKVYTRRICSQERQAALPHGVKDELVVKSVQVVLATYWSH